MTSPGTLPIADESVQHPARGAQGTLLVFAHRDEATAFSDISHLVTGVGKINAAGALAQALGADQGISRIVVLGTAGIVDDGPNAPTLDTVYQVVRAIQHDFSLPSPPIAIDGDVIVPQDRVAAIATGDVFVQDDAQRSLIAAGGAALVDMETYAYASVCARFGVALQVFKVPSDFADSGTSDEEWDTIVFRKSEQLRSFWEAHLREEQRPEA